MVDNKKMCRNYLKYADRKTGVNSAHPDQTASIRNSLIRVHTVCHFLGNFTRYFHIEKMTSSSLRIIYRVDYCCNVLGKYGRIGLKHKQN